MTTFAQWRSPSSRLAASCAEVKARKYDIRVVDQFYAYCQAVARTESDRESAARLQHAAKGGIWRMLIVASFLSYYVIERVAQAMTQF